MSGSDDHLEKVHLLVCINQLERELQDARLKEEGYRTMIKTVGKAFKIPIRKKSSIGSIQ